MDNANRPSGNGLAASPPGVPVLEIDDSLLLDVSEVLCAAIEQDHGAITLATPEHQQRIDLHLENRGIDVPAPRAGVGLRRDRGSAAGGRTEIFRHRA